MDPVKIGKVKTIFGDLGDVDREANECLSNGWVLLKPAEIVKYPSRCYFVQFLGEPREKKPGEQPLLAPIDTSTRDLQKFNLSGGQCEGSNESPGQ